VCIGAALSSEITVWECLACPTVLKWDRFTGEDSPQAALYMQFCLKLFQNTFQDQLADIAKADGVDKEMWALYLLLQKPNDAWWDETATPDKRETRDDILIRSFQGGYAATVAALGKERSTWKWGALHQSTFVSNPLGRSGIKPVKSLVNQGPVPTSGSTECLNKACSILIYIDKPISYRGTGTKLTQKYGLFADVRL
jgi:penicillin amidase